MEYMILTMIIVAAVVGLVIRFIKKLKRAASNNCSKDSGQCDSCGESDCQIRKFKQ